MQFHSNVSNSTRLLGHWVRKKGIMPLELAVRRLTFGEVLLEEGTHTGSYPDRVLHHARYQDGRR